MMMIEAEIILIMGCMQIIALLTMMVALYRIKPKKIVKIVNLNDN